MRYRYYEGGEEKPLPTSVARGASVRIVAEYDAAAYDVPTLQATGIAGYQTELAGGAWKIDFTMEEDARLSLSFTRRVYYYAVTTSSGEGGRLTLSGASDYARVQEGTALTVVATANEGYELESLTAGSEDIKASGRFVVRSNTEVRATFCKKTYSVTLPSVPHASIPTLLPLILW